MPFPPAIFILGELYATEIIPLVSLPPKATPAPKFPTPQAGEEALKRIDFNKNPL